MLFPVALGAGKRLFGQTAKLLALRQVERTQRATLIVIYRAADEDVV